MVKLSNVRVYDLNECIIASRNAMRTELPIYTQKEFDDSLYRAKNLAKSPSNSGHPNFLTGIRVSFDMIYPNYFSPEFQRYHFADIVTSSSKMHRLSSIVSAKSFNEYVKPEVISMMQQLADNFNNNPTYENRMIMLSNCPQGIELFMRISTNYMQLRTIYAQRYNHRLKEDWGAFCKMVEELPYFSDFINPYGLKRDEN